MPTKTAATSRKERSKERPSTERGKIRSRCAGFAMIKRRLSLIFRSAHSRAAGTSPSVALAPKDIVEQGDSSPVGLDLLRRKVERQMENKSQSGAVSDADVWIRSIETSPIGSSLLMRKIERQAELLDQLDFVRSYAPIVGCAPGPRTVVSHSLLEEMFESSSLFASGSPAVPSLAGSQDTAQAGACSCSVGLQGLSRLVAYTYDPQSETSITYDSIPSVEVSPTSVEDIDYWTRASFTASHSNSDVSTASYKSHETEHEHLLGVSIPVPRIEYSIPLIPFLDMTTLQSALENRMPAALVPVDIF